MERLLNFQGAEFKKGLNFLVVKYDKAVDHLRVGDITFIKGWNGLARIEKIYICALSDIPDEVFKNEADPRCRTLKGLIEVLSTEVCPEIKDLLESGYLGFKVACIGYRLFKPYE